mmetsp:Transcript_150382/g.481276  ORF Transcript_150382/g.481276 Transcript_150382/m.481276 type:complete len:502 (-) Transcript_150382:2925-4430(-)
MCTSRTPRRGAGAGRGRRRGGVGGGSSLRLPIAPTPGSRRPRRPSRPGWRAVGAEPGKSPQLAARRQRPRKRAWEPRLPLRMPPRDRTVGLALPLLQPRAATPSTRPRTRAWMPTTPAGRRRDCWCCCCRVRWPTARVASRCRAWRGLPPSGILQPPPRGPPPPPSHLPWRWWARSRRRLLCCCSRRWQPLRCQAVAPPLRCRRRRRRLRPASPCSASTAALVRCGAVRDGVAWHHHCRSSPAAGNQTWLKIPMQRSPTAVANVPRAGASSPANSWLALLALSPPAPAPEFLRTWPMASARSAAAAAAAPPASPRRPRRPARGAAPPRGRRRRLRRSRGARAPWRGGRRPWRPKSPDQRRRRRPAGMPRSSRCPLASAAATARRPPPRATPPIGRRGAARAAACKRARRPASARRRHAAAPAPVPLRPGGGSTRPGSRVPSAPCLRSVPHPQLAGGATACRARHSGHGGRPAAPDRRPCAAHRPDRPRAAARPPRWRGRSP